MLAAPGKMMSDEWAAVADAVFGQFDVTPKPAIEPDVLWFLVFRSYSPFAGGTEKPNPAGRERGERLLKNLDKAGFKIVRVDE